MRRKNRFTQTDIEQLSAYLDGELSAQEVERLEIRLSGDPALKSHWDELRATRTLVSALPRVKPPRNYTLTPEMAGVRVRTGTYPALRFATALAAIAFVLLVGIDSLMSLSFGGAMMPAARQMDVISEQEMAAEVLPSEMLESAAAEPAEAPAAAEGLPGEELALEEEGIAVLGTMVPAGAEKAAGEAPSDGFGNAVMAPSATQPPPMLEADRVQDGEGVSEAGTPTATPLSGWANGYFEPASEPAASRRIPLLRAAEFTLAILTILLILITVTFRKRPE
jgi:hypothetical protein